MSRRFTPQFGYSEISHLAFLNWEKDGCPRGRELDYWLEAEKHLSATWHLHVKEQSLHRRSGTNKPRTGIVLRLHARPKPMQAT